MHIRKIRIRNYKCISSLEFEPTRINIIAGRNNTGKSTILEAILLGATSPAYKDELGNDVLKKVLEKSDRSLIKFGNDIAEIELEISDQDSNVTCKCVRILEVSRFVREYYNIYEEVSKHLKDILHEESKLRTLLEILRRSLYGYIIEKEHSAPGNLESCIEDINTLLESSKIVILSLIDSKCINVTITRPVDFYKIQYYTINIGKLNCKNLKICKSLNNLDSIIMRIDLENPETIDKVVEKVKKYFPELMNIRVRGLRMRRPYVTLRYGENIHVIPIDSLADGVKSMIELDLLVEVCRGGILLLEEPEVKLHPAYVNAIARKLVNLVQEGEISQLYITTHSIELIREVVENLEKKGKLQDLEIVRTYNIDGEIDYEILNGDDVLRELKDLELDIRGI